MTNSQRLALELRQTNHDYNELIGVINALPDTESPTAEQTTRMTELRAKASGTETRIEAAKVTEQREEATHANEFRTEDGESRELRALIGRANVGGIFDAALGQRMTDGAEAELQKHYGLPANSVPVSLLTEYRAASVTQTGDQQGNQQATIPVVFPTALAAFAGVDRVTVPVGEPLYPVVTAPTTGPGETAKGTAVTDTVATIAVTTLAPVRVQMQLSYAREDAAVFRGMDQTLRETMRNAIGDGLDKVALVKTDAGLLDFGTDPTAATGEETYARYIASAYDNVDGRYADGTAGLRYIVGSATYKSMGGKYRTNQSPESALEKLGMLTGGVRVSANVPAPDSNVQQAVIARAVNLRGAVQPVWSGVELLSDPYSKSSEGEIQLTAIVLSNFAVLRAAQYTRIAFRLA